MLRVLCIAVIALAVPLHASDLAELGRAYRTASNTATRAPVLQYANSHKDASGALAYLLLATREIDDHQSDAALAHLEKARKQLPSLADYIAYLSAVCHFEQHSFAEVDRALKPVLEHAPASPLADKMVVLAANAYLQDGKPKKAISLVQSHLTDLTTPEAEILLAHAFDADSNPAAALEHYQRILTDYPLSNEGPDAESDPARLQTLPPKARLARCLKMIDGSPGRARHELEALAPQLSGPDRETALVKIGVAQYQGRDNAAGFEYLKGLSVAGPELESERLYYLVRFARRLDRPDEFKAPLERLALNYPRSNLRLQAMLSAGEFFWFLHDTAQYEPLYRTCAESFPSDPAAGECLWRYAFAEYRHRSSEAAQLFETLLKRYPESDKVSSSLYFLGRTAEGKGDQSAARAWYEEIAAAFPNTFYAALGNERMEAAAVAQAHPSTAVAELLKPLNLQARLRSENFTPSVSMRARKGRADLLASVGLDDLAESELRFGARKDGQPAVAALDLAELANRRDAPDAGIRYIKHYVPGYLRLRMDASSDKFWKLAFPLPFRAALEQYCSQQSLDPFLVAALIRQESEFNPKVISRSKAYGLTQVLPITGREIGRKLNLRGFHADMLFTPDVNLRIGTYFLRSLLDRLQGQLAATLAAYNAGPGRVAKWLAWGDFAEPAEFIETIPFEETRTYVQSVLRNASIYRRLYGSKTGAIASSDGNNARKDAGPPARNAK